VGDETKLAFGAGSEAFAFTWAGDHYVVAFVDPTQGAGDIDVATMADDGTLLGGPVPVQPTPAVSDLPNLLATSSGFVVAWQEGTAGEAVVAHALDASAHPVGSGATIASTEAAQARPVLARGPGGGLVAAWMDTYLGKGGVSVATLDPSTLVPKTTQRVSPDDIGGWPWVAGNDHGLGIVWSDKAGGPYDVRFAALDPSTLAASHEANIRGDAAHDALLPRMISTDAGFLAAWEDMRGADNQIYMALVDPSGAPLGGGLVEEPNSGDANWPNMAWMGSAAAVVYYQWRDARPQIFMSFVDGTGARVAGKHDLQVTGGTGGWSKYPDVVWNGREFGVLYVDTRSGAPALWFARVACASQG
jgi:hypothetical protein